MASKTNTPYPIIRYAREYCRTEASEAITLPFAADDYQILKNFLLQYTGSRDTYTAYRREAERLAQWSWSYRVSRCSATCPDIEGYIAFCQSPPKAWIGTKVARFIRHDGKRLPNPIGDSLSLPKNPPLKMGTSPKLAIIGSLKKRCSHFLLPTAVFITTLFEKGSQK